ncbi:MAG: hypothetical protein P4L35_04235 [Ignavibacteriaceae bacterium]|nr:hypothetical protein [Ignavibacteriaceae bacterium]
MNSKNDLILNYIEGKLSGEDKNKFESELKNSSSLQKELAAYRNVYNQFSGYKEIPSDDDYFRNMIPRFRSKLPGKLKRFPLQKVSFAAAASLIVVMFMFLLLNKTNQTPNLTENLDEHELTELWDKFSSDVSPSEFSSDVAVDSTINALYLNEINITPEIDAYYFADRRSDISTIVKDINDEEADNIYKEIINKKYF